MGWENTQLIERLAGAQRGRHSGVLTVHGPAAKLEVHLIDGSAAFVGNALGGRDALDDKSCELLEKALRWSKVAMTFTHKAPSVLRHSTARLNLERLVTRAIRDHFDDYHSGVRPVPEGIMPGRRVSHDGAPPVPPSAPHARVAGARNH
ncbi:MAG: DUF4388 domain-containing protein [Polyangiaceae bacterium]|nr:DUF4388 domain-containing protein [Polyangiaceae bacterium]MCB9608521.1 DUF4388 domain-containing protein [Polyangiaceae bacterium]